MSLSRFFGVTEPASGGNDLRGIRQHLLDRMTVLTAALGMLVFLVATFQALRSHQGGTALVYTMIYAWLVVVTFVRKIPYSLRSYGYLAIFFALGVFSLLTRGLTGSGVLILLSFSILVSILSGPRSGFVALVLDVVALAAIGFSISVGWLPAPAQFSNTNLADWLTLALIFILLASLGGNSLTRLIQGMDQSFQQQKELTQELNHQQRNLEQIVQDRTQELMKQANQLEAASLVARDISAETNLDVLLERTTELISTHFGYYHAGIFLLDENKEYAVLKASNSSGGKEMLANGHRLHKGSEGIVGYVIEKGQPRVTTNVEVDSVHYKNPYLPKTRSEVALPIKSRDEVIGALDIQSTTENAFSNQEIKVLQTIADQLSTAIDRTSLVKRLQESIAELESTAQQFTRKAWQEHIGPRHDGYSYRVRHGSLDLNVESNARMEQALRDGKVLVGTDAEGRMQAAVPIVLRGQSIGVINLAFQTPAISADVLNLVQAVADRMALSLETARLLEQVQIRAEREHMVGDISAKVRSESDVDSILRTTAQELGRMLGLSEVLVQLKPGESN